MPQITGQGASLPTYSPLAPASPPVAPTLPSSGFAKMSHPCSRSADRHVRYDRYNVTGEPLVLYEPLVISSGHASGHASSGAVGGGAAGSADERESVDSSSRDEMGSLSIHATMGSHAGARAGGGRAAAERSDGALPPMGGMEKELRTSRI